MTENLSPADVNFEVARIEEIYPEGVLGRRPDLKSIVRRSDSMMIHTMHADVDYDLETLSAANIREILLNHLPCGVSFWWGETKVWEGNAKRLLQYGGYCDDEEINYPGRSLRRGDEDHQEGRSSRRRSDGGVDLPFDLLPGRHYEARPE